MQARQTNENTNENNDIYLDEYLSEARQEDEEMAKMSDQKKTIYRLKKAGEAFLHGLLLLAVGVGCFALSAFLLSTMVATGGATYILAVPALLFILPGAIYPIAGVVRMVEGVVRFGHAIYKHFNPDRPQAKSNVKVNNVVAISSTQQISRSLSSQVAAPQVVASLAGKLKGVERHSEKRNNSFYQTISSFFSGCFSKESSPEPEKVKLNFPSRK